jgi:hypothetical protein
MTLRHCHNSHDCMHNGCLAALLALAAQDRHIVSEVAPMVVLYL